MPRLSKDNWLEEGLKILSEFAQNKLRILYLCERLGVTRGSFYHHFTSIENFISELMKKWESDNTQQFILAANEAQSPYEKMEILNRQVLAANQSVEAAIRSWSFYNEIVKEHLRSVDEQRLTFLIEIFVEGGESPEKAALLAEIDYALLVGLQQLNPRPDPQKFAALFKVYSDLRLQ